MKKNIIVLILGLLSISNIDAQSSNYDRYTDQALYDMFRNKTITYDSISKWRVKDYIKWYHENLTYGYEILFPKGFISYDRYTRPNPIEIVDENENIYTYPVAHRSKNKQDSIVFFNTHMDPENYAGYYIDGYPKILATMDKIKIGDNIADIETLFRPLYKNNRVQIIRPNGYVIDSKHPNNLLLSVNAKCEGTPSIIYTEPQYIVLAGQLVEVNSGINYDVPLHDIGVLFQINTSTMTSKLISLKGITNIRMKCDSQGELYFSNYSTYSEGWDERLALSQKQSPIYIASIDESSNGDVVIETAIIPKDGDVIIDIERSIDGEYLFLCGSTTKQGYIGYNNAIFIIMKKNNDNMYEEIARYRSKEKGKYYTQIVVLDDEHVGLRDNIHPDDNGSHYEYDVLNFVSIMNGE